MQFHTDDYTLHSFRPDRIANGGGMMLLSLKQVFWKKSVFQVTSTITVQC